jgi:hypothetical protein
MKPLIFTLLLLFGGAATVLPHQAGNSRDSTIEALVLNVNTMSIASTIQGLEHFTTRHWSYPNRDTVSSWIRSEFLALGLTDVRFDSFACNGTVQRNVVATMSGALHPELVIVIGAHYDSQSSDAAHAPGADDNASGTAAVLEIARVLQSVQFRPNVTLKFVAFAAEEAGLLGSAAYASECRTDGMEIKLMMNFDMIGYRDSLQADRDLYVVTYPGSERFSNLFAALSSAYTTLTPIFTSNYRSGSDSYSFYQYGYDAFFAIERDFNPFYHSPNDRFVYLDMAYAREVIESGLATLLLLDRVPPPPQALWLRDCGNGHSLSATVPADSLADRAGYAFYVGPSSGGTTMRFSGDSPSFTLLGLSGGTEYTVGVSLLDEMGMESPLIEATAVPRSVPLPPTGFNAVTAVPYSRVAFSWRRNDEMDLAGYRLERMFAADTGFTVVKAVPQPDTSVTDTIVEACLYRLRAIDSTGLVSAPSETLSVSPFVAVRDNRTLPGAFSLEQNFPNPFNPITTITFSLPHREAVRLTIFDLLGREIARLVDGVRGAGTSSVVWNSANLSGGVYYYRLQSASGVFTKSMILSK